MPNTAPAREAFAINPVCGWQDLFGRSFSVGMDSSGGFKGVGAVGRLPVPLLAQFFFLNNPHFSE